MRNWPRTLGYTAVLTALVGVAGWMARPDLLDRVRLVSSGSVPWITPGDQASSVGRAGSAAVPTAPCTQADLDIWQMPTPPEVASRHVTLYSDRFGTKRAEQGDILVPGVRVASVAATQITLMCQGESSLKRELRPAAIASPEASASQRPARPLAPLGN